MLVDGSKKKEFFDSMNEEDWDIIGFDPTVREACVRINKNVGEKDDITFTVNLPYLVIRNSKTNF